VEAYELEHVDGVPFPLIRDEARPCPYLPGRDAVMQVALPWALPQDLHRKLMDLRFRRSGEIVYRPDCPTCTACVPIRVPVNEFVPSRSQRRVWRQNADITGTTTDLEIDDAHRDLFIRYQRHQHDGHLTQHPDELSRFLGSSPGESFQLDLRLDDQLLAVSVIDVGEDALSSVYCYYDPTLPRRSLGVLAGLWEIETCRRRGVSFWYLGYHVSGCRKMEYKTRFRPHELLGRDGQWHRSR
jgi:arginyl-tRNA--protein-N-Asp/Glu arginylyltransferase